jgi:formylglycine-generating enzyme required for sulfatase activity
VELEMAVIPGGTFMMGSSEGDGDDSERPQHSVIVSSFLMSKYPITQKQWRAVLSHSLRETATLDKIEIDLEPDPSYRKGDKRPVENVMWGECVEFCKRLSKLTGREYGLPSEAQWEYSCRAGTKTPFYFGETITSDLANYNGNYVFASEPKGQYREETTPVGQFPPNAFDYTICMAMYGNGVLMIGIATMKAHPRMEVHGFLITIILQK